MDGTFEVIPTQMTYGGAAFARRDDGLPLFVAGALPGERVRVRITDDRGRFAHAQVTDLLAPSSDRVSPPCAHFGRCGGCQWQHIAYAAQLAYKCEIVREQFRRIGRLETVEVLPTVASPDPYAYRTHITAHPLPGRGLGFVGVDEQIIPIQTCHIIRPPLQRLLDRAQVLPPGHWDANARIRLQVGSADDDTYIDGADEVGSVEYTLLRRRFLAQGGAFFQANLALTELLITRLIEVLRPKPDDRALDLYAGVGLFTRFLAETCVSVTWVESSAAALACAVQNLAEFPHVQFWHAPVERALRQERPRAEMVVVDPPRAGLKPDVLATLPASGARHIAYVSCDPSTLARDCAGLVKAGYRVVFVQPFDMFPQTYHIETLTLLERTA